MTRPTNLRVGDMFRVIEADGDFKVGEIISLKIDDGTENPFFWKENKSSCCSIRFSDLEPYTKTIRDVQVGEVVIDKDAGDERMVLERGQNTVGLSSYSAFKEFGETMTLDDLEKYYTLKAEPEPVDDKIAEAIKLLEKAGYNIEKKNAQPSNCQAGGIDGGHMVSKGSILDLRGGAGGRPEEFGGGGG